MDPPAEASRDRRAERAVTLLRRVLAVGGALARGLTRLAVWTGVTVIAAWLLWLSESPPSGGSWIGRSVALALFLLPSAILLLFVAGLRKVFEIPDRTRELPAELRGRTAELRERARRTTRSRGVLGTVASLFQLGRLVLGSQDALTPYATIAVALRPTILLAASLAAVAAAIEFPAALLALLVLLLA